MGCRAGSGAVKEAGKNDGSLTWAGEAARDVKDTWGRQSGGGGGGTTGD